MIAAFTPLISVHIRSDAAAMRIILIVIITTRPHFPSRIGAEAFLTNLSPIVTIWRGCTILTTRVWLSVVAASIIMRDVCHRHSLQTIIAGTPGFGFGVETRHLVRVGLAVSFASPVVSIIAPYAGQPEPVLGRRPKEEPPFIPYTRIGP